MQSTTAFQYSLLPFNSVHLGRLVCNISSPECVQCFKDPSSDNPPEFIVTPRQDFQELLNPEKTPRLREHLSRLLPTSNGGQCFTHLLRNPRSWFSDACASPEMRIWLENLIEQGDDVYLVAGVYTLVNPRLSGNLASIGEGDGDGDGGVIPSGALTTSASFGTGVDSTRDIGNRHHSTACAPGEQIYAILYHKVQFNWYSSRKIERGFLEQNNRWKIYWEIQCLRNDEDYEDIIEAVLADETELERSDEVYIGVDGEIL